MLPLVDCSRPFWNLFKHKSKSLWMTSTVLLPIIIILLPLFKYIVRSSFQPVDDIRFGFIFSSVFHSINSLRWFIRSCMYSLLFFKIFCNWCFLAILTFIFRIVTIKSIINQSYLYSERNQENGMIIVLTYFHSHLHVLLLQSSLVFLLLDRINSALYSILKNNFSVAFFIRISHTLSKITKTYTIT